MAYKPYAIPAKSKPVPITKYEKFLDGQIFWLNDSQYELRYKASKKKEMYLVKTNFKKDKEFYCDVFAVEEYCFLAGIFFFDKTKLCDIVYYEELDFGFYNPLGNRKDGRETKKI